MIAVLTPILLFIAFILLLLVSLSVPIIKSIFLFRLLANVSVGILNSSVNASVNFGVWGYCTSGVDVKVVGINENTAATCSKAHLGYTFDSTVANALHISGIENLISRTLTAVLVLNPIACGLTFLAFVISLLMLRRNHTGESRVSALCTLGVAILAAILTTVVFLINVILVAVVRKRVNDHSDHVLTLNWGNAVWMTLGAAIALWVSLVGACAGICAHRRNRKAQAERY